MIVYFCPFGLQFELLQQANTLAFMVLGPGIMKASAFASAARIQIGDQKDKNKQSCSEYVWN